MLKRMLEENKSDRVSSFELKNQIEDFQLDYPRNFRTKKFDEIANRLKFYEQFLSEEELKLARIDLNFKMPQIRWIKTDGSADYIIKINNNNKGIWKEFHENKLYTTFKEIEHEVSSVILYDEDRDGYFKLTNKYGYIGDQASSIFYRFDIFSTGCFEKVNNSGSEFRKLFIYSLTIFN